MNLSKTLPSTPTSKLSPLFRSEAVKAQSSQWMGGIRLAQPISNWLIAGVSLILASLIISYVIFGSVNKKTRVTGIIVPVGGTLSISAPNPGILVASHVHEGDKVVQGQTLFTLSTARQNQQGEVSDLIDKQLIDRIDTLQDEYRIRHTQYQEKKRALADRIANVQIELMQIEDEITLAKRRESLSQQSVQKFELLQKNGYISSAQTQQKQEEALDVATRINTLLRNKTQLHANLLSLKAELQSLTSSLSADLVQIERAKAGVKQELIENNNRRSNEITAPQKGIITAIPNQTGQTVTGGQVLASLIPNTTEDSNDEIEAHLYAPSRTIGFVMPGQEVLIRYSAFPYQKFGLQAGTIIDISDTPFAPNEIPPHLASTILSNAQQNIAGFNSNEALYRIKVKLKSQTINAMNKNKKIKPGMTLEADLLQDKRKIWEWIVEPVLAVKAQISGT